MTGRKRTKKTADPEATETVDTSPKFPVLDGIADAAEKRTNARVIRKASVVPGFRHIETGVFGLDLGLLGGVPENQFTMIYGWESTRKSSIAMTLVSAAQRKYPDKAAVFVDMEHTYDPLWATTNGVDNDRVYLVQPEKGEEAVDIIEAVIRSGEASIVVLDSLPALVPMNIIDASAEDAKVAEQARLIGRLCSVSLAAMKASRLNHGHGPAVIFINQFRTKIGVSFGDPRVLPGGHQPKFVCTTMIETKKKKEHMGKDRYDLDIVTHTEFAWHIKKSKVGCSSRDGEYVMIQSPDHPLGQGAIDDARQIVVTAKKMGFVGGGGTRWTMQGIDSDFPSQVAIVEYIAHNEPERNRLGALCLAERRAQMGLSAFPVDGYLWGTRYEP